MLSGIYDLIYFYFRIATDGDYGLASGFDLDMNSFEHPWEMPKFIVGE